MTRRIAIGLFGLFAVNPGCGSAQNGGSPGQISPEEVEKMLARKDVFFLDVRPPAEIEQLGSVDGYVNIPIDQLESRLGEIPKDKLIVTL